MSLFIDLCYLYNGLFYFLEYYLKIITVIAIFIFKFNFLKVCLYLPLCGYL